MHPGCALRHQLYGSRELEMEKCRIPPICNLIFGPALSLQLLCGWFFHLACPRLKTYWPCQVLPQRTARQSGRPIQKGSHTHTRAQLHSRSIRLCCEKWKIPINQDHPNQQTTRSDSRTGSEGRPSNPKSLYQGDILYSLYVCR